MSLAFLSDGWLDGLESALRVAASERGDGDTALVTIGQIVTGAPGGDVAYAVTVGGGGVPIVEHGSVETASVTLVTDYETARAIAAGTDTAAAALGEGRLKVRGDANALLGAQDALATLAPALESLRAATQF